MRAGGKSNHQIARGVFLWVAICAALWVAAVLVIIND
jgi:hypothetical protein